MAGYNITRYVEELLEHTDSLPPSFTVHLHVEYWTLNNGSKFLYNNQIASLLDDVRAHRIPVDFLDLFEAAKVPFYDGCMIVELLDYRPQRNREPLLEKPERTRAVLHPNSETLWADICATNQRYGGKWSDRDALEIEARLLLATAPPLCLVPDPHLARIANHVTRVSTPTVPVSLKRKAAAMDTEEDETDKARRAKIMQFMNPRQNRTVTPSYRILDAIQRSREKRDTGPEPTAVPAAATVLPSSAASSPTKPPTPSITVSQTHSPADSEDKKKTKTTTTAATTTFARANGSLTPVPPATTHQFISQNPPTPNAHSPLQPQVYPSVQAATEAAKRTPTPAQLRNYASSPRPPTSKTPAPVQPAQNIPPQTSTFQAQVPTSHFLSQPPTRGAGKAGTAANGAKAVPQISPAALAQAQLMYAQQLQQGHQVQQQLQQRMNAQKNGRATPQIQAAKSPAARNSPMVTNKSLAARSPMPPTTQLPAQQQPQQGQQSQQPQPAQHPQHTFTPTYNPAHLRPLVHVNPQLPAHLAGAAAAATTANGQAHAPNSNTNTNSNPTATTASPQLPQAQPQPQQSQPQQQQQQQTPLHMYTPQMYYPPMNYTPTMQAHAQRLYWQQQQQQQHGAMAAAAARGMPSMVNVNVNVNGQPGMMSGAHAQQVQMAAAKAGSAGIQGR